ncbi:hypothetical protein I350_05576 [Cryptococcus amylolentus CBS 6273]|uniref:Uncharacterized protein n=1 Tax=Cryptococcus amylolentus CBS 6273 TaxID=1296118 RepID=A0A1E3JVV0_9TREE|nr:hypothetical protein I350_05576 [Cryptococcus amylolentus CBS 6273]
MPTESSLPLNSVPPHPPDSAILKCSLCGVPNPSATVLVPTSDCIGLSDPDHGERVCLECAALMGVRPVLPAEGGEEQGLERGGLGRVNSRDGVVEDSERISLERAESGRTEDEPVGDQARGAETDTPEPQLSPPPLSDIPPDDLSRPQSTSSSSLASSPSPLPPPPKAILPASSKSETISPIDIWNATRDEGPPHRINQVANLRQPNVCRGSIYPGSVFKGKQTSGRSSYDVEIRFLEVDFANSHLSGYLSIVGLTEAHPHLTTLFTAEIIGPKYGFITGPRYAASEQDDLRHWGRFEQFRRGSTRDDLRGEELFLREVGEDERERDFVFMRMKERFLVPDHSVKDISGASFAGFYYAMIDFGPCLAMPSKSPRTAPQPTDTHQTSTVEPVAPGQNLGDLGRMGRGLRPGAGRKSSGGVKREEPSATGREATIRGYYFHSLNQEPFQELALTHVPQKSCSTWEYR